MVQLLATQSRRTSYSVGGPTTYSECLLLRTSCCVMQCAMMVTATAGPAAAGLLSC